MPLSDGGLFVVTFIGLLAGWTVGNIDRGSGLGLAADIIVGIVGALIATLPSIHSPLGHGLVSLLMTAPIGAMVLLLVVRALPLVWNWARGARNEPARGFEGRWKTVELQEAKRFWKPR